MAYVIAEPCIGVKDTVCVDACPVDCIHPRKTPFTTTGARVERVVIGRHEAPGIFGRLRSNAYATIRESPCPVVSV